MIRKRIQAEFSFNEYWLYIVLHKKEGRRMANLVHKNNKTRKTYAYAKYLMCVNEKRILSKDEQVDHIDGNKLNDTIENLQILSLKDNMRKMPIETGKSAKPVECICTYCNNKFYREARQVNWKIKNGVKLFCTKDCLHQSLRKNKVVDK